MKIGELVQQGDVLLKRVGEIPAEARKVSSENGFLILAKGEATGHAHKIAATPHVELLEYDGKLWLKIKKLTPLEHEEHHILKIESGEYEIGRVRERDHFSRITREVED